MKQKISALLVFLFTVLLMFGCKNYEDVSVEDVRTPVRLTVQITAEQISSSDFICSDLQISEKQNTDFWVDRMLVGTSTISELINLKELTDVSPVKEGSWTFRDGDIVLDFKDGVLIAKDDPRKELGEIVQKYGLPSHVILIVPKKEYHLATERTYLAYDNNNVIFYVDELILDFSKAVRFEFSEHFLPSAYFEFLGKLHEGHNNYETLFFDWPCNQPFGGVRFRRAEDAPDNDPFLARFVDASNTIILTDDLYWCVTSGSGYTTWNYSTNEFTLEAR